MLYLHPKSLSPDPTYGRRLGKSSGNHTDIELFPHELLQALPDNPQTRQWGSALNLFRKPAELPLKAGAFNRASIMLDFGTELDGQLVLETKSKSAFNLMACFGESEPEAAGLVPGYNPNPGYYWHIEKGIQRIVHGPRGFRFVRLVFSDVGQPLTLRQVSVRAALTFRERQGDFQCSDTRFQRVWQSSVYTARLCTQQETIWDGIKRDRVGWYGDARIIKLVGDNVFFDPRPAEAMLAAMPSDQWSNTIPNYSFDGMAMLKQHILYYGQDRPCIRLCYDRILQLLNWVQRTQVNRDGLIIRTDQPLFGNVGFVDWSSFPTGGRLEELCWLQCQYLAALRHTRKIAIILGDRKAADRISPQIDALARLLYKRFWNHRLGFIHTLNHVGQPKPAKCTEGWHCDPFETPMHNIHYRATYEQKIRLGPSGASRQANALAVLAGLATPKMARTILRRVLDNPRVTPVITGYFLYYEQMARGLCGDPAGAVMNFRDYMGPLLEREGAATTWELYNPELTDLRRYFGLEGKLWTWPVSLCHGWSAGAVPVAAQFLLGILPVAPGYGKVDLNPCRAIPWSFSATVPTPHGTIRVEKEKKGGRIAYAIPKGIALTPETQARVGGDFIVRS